MIQIKVGPALLVLIALTSRISDAMGEDMHRLVKCVISLLTLTGLGILEQARAVDFVGAWATNADECRRVFVRKGRAKQITFTADSEQYGGGFIAEAGRLRGKSANCRIKTMKEDGESVNIIAGCATDIMLSNVQFSLKLIGPNKIARLFPGIVDMEIDYYRCPI